MNSEARKLTVNLADRSYDINIAKGLLSYADKYMNLNRRIFIITDSGVPKEYSKTVFSLCKEAMIFTFEQGEINKNLTTYAEICKQMLAFGLQRKDAVVAIGGGVVGDIAAFCASTYMRGIDFYNIPTTLLSQVDSSIGGKNGVDFEGVKNIIGTFYQPKGVLIDTEVLKTLPQRQFSAGLAEVIKMALTSDEELFSLLESGLYKTNIEETIARALDIKRRVVEADEREGGIRKILNFGHTFGHGIEALGGMLHGECVSLGMIPMLSKEIRGRVIALLKKVNLPTEFRSSFFDAIAFMMHDKKGDGDSVDAIFVDRIGCARIEKLTFTELEAHIKDNLTEVI